MKKTICTVRAFLTLAVFVALHHLQASAQTSLPDTLPVGLSPALDAMIASDSYNVFVRVEFDSADGGTCRSGTFNNGMTFTCWSDFQQFIAAESFAAYGSLQRQTNAVSDIRLIVSTVSSTSGNAFTIKADMGMALGWDSFSRLYPGIASVSLSIPIPEGSSLKIVVGNNQPVYLTNGASSIDSSLLADGSERIRYTLTLLDGSAAVYTQTGDRIFQPILSYQYEPAYSYTNIWYDDVWGQDDNGDWTTIGSNVYTDIFQMPAWYSVTLVSTPGTDVCIEAESDDQPGVWQTLTHVGWQDDNGSAAVYCDPTTHIYNYFRARSE